MAERLYRPALMIRWGRPRLGGRVRFVRNTTAPRLRPLIWRNPPWTKVRVGSRRHYVQVSPRWTYRRVIRRVERKAAER